MEAGQNLPKLDFIENGLVKHFVNGQCFLGSP